MDWFTIQLVSAGVTVLRTVASIPGVPERIRACLDDRTEYLRGPIPPQRVLDELASALGPRATISSLDLASALQKPLNLESWNGLAKRLDCDLPPLEGCEGHWSFPPDCRDVPELADLVAAQRTDWDPPESCTLRDWREAHIFVMVRSIIAKQLVIDERMVSRSARLIEDLRAD